MKQFILVISILLSLCGYSYSQKPNGLTERRIQYVNNIYANHIINDTKAILNGKQYTYTNDAYQSDPFFHSNNWTKGCVIFDGKKHENLPLKYDIEKDVLVYYHATAQGGSMIALNKSKINEFNIHGHQFMKVKNAPCCQGDEAGFFEQLISGYASLYIKSQKQLKENNNLRFEYVSKNIIFVKINDQFYSIKHRRDLLNAFNDKKKEIKSFIRDNNIIVRDKMNKNIGLIVTYYNELQENKYKDEVE